jgi:adenylate kinase family enzyme
MQQKTFIFIGRSGSGKGTQARLVQEYFEKNDPVKRPVFYLETGSKFREFITRDTYTASLAHQTSQKGSRQPDFLALWMWAHYFIDELKGGEHIIVDGTPRSKIEAEVLDTALHFYERNEVCVVFLNVSREWSIKHLMARGRDDDTRENIEARLDWFDKDVMPAVEYYREHPDYNLIELNGEEEIEIVHQKLVAAAF